MADDTSPDPASPARLLALTARIVSAQVGGNKVDAAELPRLVQAVHRTLDGLTRDPAEAEPPRPEPAVPVRRSVRPDAITCLVCGRRFTAIKRHLAAEHGLTPEGYRARWGLPADYPLVAPDYADTRSRLAKRIGLGRKRAPEPEVEPEVAGAAPEPEAEAVPAEEPAPPPAAKRRGRRKAGAAPGVEQPGPASSSSPSQCRRARPSRRVCANWNSRLRPTADVHTVQVLARLPSRGEARIPFGTEMRTAL